MYRAAVLKYSVILPTALNFALFCVHIRISTLLWVNNHTLTMTNFIVTVNL
jgi:hypothetical protein